MPTSSCVATATGDELVVALAAAEDLRGDVHEERNHRAPQARSGGGGPDREDERSGIQA
jgi:hypothetical protein